MSLSLPYTALRAFEAVVRQRGFGRAAEELGVTQSAVSQHVKSLEDWTGRRLLNRGPRETMPTAEGQMLADAVIDGLGRIEGACEQLRKPGRGGTTLDIACPPGFAINWLFPRLLHFDQAHPDIPVSIATHFGAVDFGAGGIDAAIQYGPGGFSGLHAEPLMGEAVFPVCSPGLLASGPPLASVEDLARHTVLVDDLSQNAGTPPTWGFWAAAAGVTLPRAARVRRFGQSNLVIEAAKQGLGVALGRGPLVIDALAAGDLVRPFAADARSEYSYWLVCPKRAVDSAPLIAFRNWIMEAATGPDLSHIEKETRHHGRMD